jgi:hypothetical protein
MQRLYPRPCNAATYVSPVAKHPTATALLPPLTKGRLSARVSGRLVGCRAKARHGDSALQPHYLCWNNFETKNPCSRRDNYHCLYMACLCLSIHYIWGGGGEILSFCPVIVFPFFIHQRCKARFIDKIVYCSFLECQYARGITKKKGQNLKTLSLLSI